MPSRASLFSFLALLALAPTLPAETVVEPGKVAWRAGQQAMEHEEYDQAIGHFQVSLRCDPSFTPARLSLAAAYLAVGEDRQALPHLKLYLDAKPDHLSVRAHYAELLFRLGMTAEARPHFERVVVEAQRVGRLEDEHLVHCHTRLMEIAEGMGDEYAAHLNRGIGLYHLARQHHELKDNTSAATAEGLLCKAAAELTLAREQLPNAARPCWYLHEVWSRLAQRQPAQRWLHETEARVSLADLTPMEKRNLRAAWDCNEEERRGRK
jgi:tetratricopeptide (TPR) repeat protein